MKKLLLFAVVIAAMLAAACSNSKYKYETVKGDPLNTKIYTLDNGLKVYMSVNKETPRIQTYIAVNVGGKNDPAETTGLAHYFEHLMFKGTQQFGTSDFAAEKPMLDEIENLFEVYRKTTDEAERAAIYHRIDSISYEASKIAIPNEYDKLMSAIGANGTNAFTSQDMTVYVEDIPSNEIDNWAKIQADRFQEPRDPRLPHRAGDHLRGEEHVADAATAAKSGRPWTPPCSPTIPTARRPYWVHRNT